MKKWIAVALGIVTTVGSFGCSHQKQSAQNQKQVAEEHVMPATSAPAKPTTAQLRTDLNSAVIPAPKLNDQGQLNSAFARRHEQYIERAKKGNVGLLFLGDSITQGWEKVPKLWEDAWSKYEAANFGIGGDRTQHVLWRIENGELDGIHPKVAVIMIGTNNLSSDPWDKIAEGIEKIVHETHEKTGAKVLLLGIFPRGANPADPRVKALREKITKINDRIMKLDDGGKTVKYLDIGSKFLEPDGKITKEIMPDALHPSKEGYQREVEAIKPSIEELWNGA